MKINEDILLQYIELLEAKNKELNKKNELLQIENQRLKGNIDSALDFMENQKIRRK